MNLDQEKWLLAKEILLGGHPTRVSKTSAARAAGVTLTEFNKWIERSRARDLSDEPWIWEIAEVVDEALESQGGVLEDVAWDHAVNGTDDPVFHMGEVVGHKKKFDHNLLMRLLQRRDKSYIDKREIEVKQSIDPLEVLQRLRSHFRLLQINPNQLENDPIDAEASEIEDAPDWFEERAEESDSEFQDML